MGHQKENLCEPERNTWLFLVIATMSGLIYMTATAIGWRNTFTVVLSACAGAATIVGGVFLITGTI